MTTFHIELQIDQGEPATLEPLIHKIAVATLKQQQVTAEAVLTILITDDEELQTLNKTYRNEDKPTDVLSFEDGTEWPDGKLYLGDIAISHQMAERQAAQGGHKLLDEVALLTAHGVLHLLGHDHAEPEEKAIMWQAQGAVLAQFGINVSPAE